VPDVPPPGAAVPVPRHVLALVLLVVAVLGFAVGGSLRTAFAGTSTSAEAPTAHVAKAPQRAVVHGATPVATTGVRPQPTRRPSAAAHPVPAAHPAPAGSGSGRRIVYQERTMHLWVVGRDGSVVREYPVTGRPGWPRPGTYHVFSKSPATASPKYGVTFRWMVRFAHGRTLNIGFHDIPRTMGTGRLIQAEEDLGAPVGHGGCVRGRQLV